MSTSCQALRLVEDSLQATDDRSFDGWESDFPRLPFESSTHLAVPDWLDEMPPGSELGAVLAGIDVDRVSGYDRVVVLRAHDRMVSHHQAKRYDAMRSIHTAYQALNDDRDEVSSGVGAAGEIRCALHLTRRAADTELSFALDLSRRLPRVLHMLLVGLVDYRRARTIERGTVHVSDAVAHGVVERIAESALLMTTGEIAARIKGLCFEADPNEAKQRYEHALVDRRVVTDPLVDGTANLVGENLPPNRVTAIARRINTIATSLRRNGETRTMDQLRADIYLDLLKGRQENTTGRSTVHITADLDTLAARTDHPGDLAGYGPVISDMARQLATNHQNAKWQWTITDTETGDHLCTGTTQRRPTVSQTRTIQSRDRTCVFPGCRIPSIDCDIDHITEYADGGPTCPCNTAPDCRHDHRLKDHGWTYERQHNNTYIWTSPLGHTYSTWKAPP